MNLGHAAPNSTCEYVTEERKTAVARVVDVLVAGGGIAGCFAAIAAARMGAQTLVIDRFGQLGGNMGPGLIAGGSLEYFGSIIGGKPTLVKEFLKRVAATRGRNSGNVRKAGAASFVATSMLLEAGAEIMLSTYLCDPIVSDGTVQGVFIENKSGRRAILARTVLDASGEADVAARAGAPMFRATDVVSPAILDAMAQLKPRFPKWSGAELSRFCGLPSFGCGYQIAGIDGARAKAFQDSEDSTSVDETFPRERELDGLGTISFSPSPGQVAATCDPGSELLEGRLEARPEMEVGKVKTDPGNGDHMSKLELHARLFLFEVVQRLRGSVPGFERAYLAQVAPYLHCRGGTCIDGEYFVTAIDMLNGSRFDDVIFVPALVDDHGRQIGLSCDVPYRSMLPQRLDGLLAIGRSASHRRLLRTRPNCMVYGIVAGTAAAMAAHDGTTARTVDMPVLQQHLLDGGVHLGDPSRLAELRLSS